MENISAFLDEVMTPLVRGLPTYVKDTNHDFHIFDSFRFDTTDPGQRFLITMDVKSLYKSNSQWLWIAGVDLLLEDAWRESAFNKYSY